MAWAAVRLQLDNNRAGPESLAFLFGTQFERVAQQIAGPLATIANNRAAVKLLVICCQPVLSKQKRFPATWVAAASGNEPEMYAAIGECFQAMFDEGFYTKKEIPRYKEELVVQPITNSR